MRLVVALTLCLFMVSAVHTSPPEPETPEEPIKLGVMLSVTGAIADFGLTTKNGVELAVKEVNDAGGVHGRQLEIVFKDLGSDQEETRAAAKLLTGKEKVAACIGCVASGLTLAAAPHFQDAEIPLISPSATNPTVTEQGDMIFRACYMDDFQGWGLAQYAWSDLKSRKAAILKNKDDSYSEALAGFFQAKFEELGGSVVVVESFGRDTRDFATQIANIKAKEPEVLFVPAYYTDVGLIAQQIAKTELKTKLLGADGWESRTLASVGGDALEGAVFSSHYCETANDRSRAFAKAYREEFNAEPTSLSALGYDTVKLLAKALAAAAKDADGRAIAKALLKVSDFEGLTGSKIAMDDKRNAVKPLVMLRVKDGEIEFVRELFPDEAPKPEAK